MNPSKFYNNQVKKHKTNRIKISKKSGIFSTLRVATFLVLTVVIIYLVNERSIQAAILITIMLFAVMAILIRYHNKIKYQLRISNNLKELSVVELERIEGDFGKIESGSNHMDDHHPYSSDLDLFGEKSLYQLINQTTSFLGKNKLADWLKNKSGKEEIKKRQEAAKELAGLQEWCLEYRAVGLVDQLKEEQVAAFQNWLHQPHKLIKQNYLRTALFALPVLFFVVAIGAFVFDYTLYTTLPVLIVSGLLLNKQMGYAKQTLGDTGKALTTLQVLSQQLLLVEKANFQADYLLEVKKTVTAPKSASIKISELHKLLDQLQARNNMLHIFINLPLLLDIRWLIGLEKWKLKNAGLVEQWFEALASMESLISLSGVYFNFPNWITPTFSEEEYEQEAVELAHPMLVQDAVPNNFCLKGKGKTILITGPNMAGKSTFLRTIATSWVLAQMGAPVRAKKFMFNPEALVFTAMRVKDNLNESVSSFYAELDRIKSLIERIKSGEKCLYFLDEILKGTNSADRHKGAEALIVQLHKLEATGFVSTHDLELGELASKEGYVHNYSFESTIENGSIAFDYTIREGICSSFNACELMRQMGIEVS